MATHSSILTLENPMDRRAWQAAVHRVAKSQTQLKRLSMHAHCLYLGTFSELARLDLSDSTCSVNSSYSCITMLTHLSYTILLYLFHNDLNITSDFHKNVTML